MPGSTKDHWGRQDAAQAIASVSSLLPSLCLLRCTSSLVFSCGFARADDVYLLGCQDHVACGDSKQRSYTAKFVALPIVKWATYQLESGNFFIVSSDHVM